MATRIVNEYEPDYVSPPGETLEEILNDRETSQIDLARRTGRTSKFINEIIKGKARITPDFALELERVMGIPDSFWNNRQRHYDAFKTRKKESEALMKSIEWAKKFPYSKMAGFKCVPDINDKLERLKNLLNFFGVASPDAWHTTWDNTIASCNYRKSAKFSTDEYALAAWLRRGELVAHAIECRKYNRTNFMKALRKIRGLTTLCPNEFQPKLIDICRLCGVVVAFIPEFPKTASGATRWITPSKALIQLSLKYKTNDHFWFTFFHEAAHILFHQKRPIFIEDGNASNAHEQEADDFATEWLIPSNEYYAFIDQCRSSRISKHSIKSFAEKIGIAPGIIVGRLQHNKKILHSHCNDLKISYNWIIN